MDDNTDLIALTIDVVSAFVGQNNLSPEAVPGFIASTHAAIVALKNPPETAADTAEEDHVPAVSSRKSLASKDFILSMIDGKPYKTLRRHLATHGLTADEYRARYKLAASYPMVAESYSAHRRDLARKIGLGRKPGSAGARPAPAAAQNGDTPAAETKAPRKAAAAPKSTAPKAPRKKAEPKPAAK